MSIATKTKIERALREFDHREQFHDVVRLAAVIEAVREDERAEMMDVVSWLISAGRGVQFVPGELEIRALAASNPLEACDQTVQCSLCLLAWWGPVAETGPMDSPKWHHSTCPWRAAREWTDRTDARSK